MLVKKFTAENMTAALKQVKETLGSEALILSTRTIGKKGLGVLGKQLIEVTAAVESPAMKAAGERPEPQSASMLRAARSSQQRVETLEDERVSLSQQVRSEAPRASSVEVAGIPVEDEIRQLRAQLEAQDIGRLQTEIAQLKELMAELTREREQQQTQALAAGAGETPVQQQPILAPVESAPVTRLQTTACQQHADLLDMLLERGIDAEAAGTIARFAEPQMNDYQRQDSRQCREFLTRTLAGLVQTETQLYASGQGQKRIALVGATGVGKTTTVAKLAATAIAEHGARVALVTIDTYRIAAVEQLKVYGDIMGVPVDVVLSPEQLQEAFRRHADKDLILIDTAGRSPRDSARIEELHEFLGEGAGVENCLVLAAPTEERLQQQSLAAFGKLPLSRLIFTKLDETDRCGALINIPTRSNLPLAYLTNGQQVPEDLWRAEATLVADLVMGTVEQSRREAV